MISRGRLWPCSRGSLPWRSKIPPSWTGEWLQEGMLVARPSYVKAQRKETRAANWELFIFPWCSMEPSVPPSILSHVIKGFLLTEILAEKKKNNNCGWCSEELIKLYVRNVCKGKWAAFPRPFHLERKCHKAKSTKYPSGYGKGSRSSEDCDLTTERTRL